jgi:hypothetical protein
MAFDSSEAIEKSFASPALIHLITEHIKQLNNQMKRHPLYCFPDELEKVWKRIRKQ